MVVSSHEIGIADATGGSNQPANIHAGIFAEVNTGRICQDHLTIGRDMAEDLAWVVTHHPIEGDAVGIRLLKFNFRILADIERLPVNRSTIAALLDDHVGATLADAGIPCTDLPTSRQGIRWWCRLGICPLHQQTTQHMCYRNLGAGTGLAPRGGDLSDSDIGLFAGVPNASIGLIHGRRVFPEI